MKILALLLATLCLSMSPKQVAKSCPKPLRVAIVDTGLDLDDPRFRDLLCDGTHKNFVGGKMIDDYGHGTHIAGLIKQYAGSKNYCLLIYKFYSDANPGSVNLSNEISAIQLAISSGADIINLSEGGPEFDEREYILIKDNPGVLFISAAGNDGKDLDKPENEYYPSSYFLDNQVVVSSLTADGKRAPTSNYGNLVTEKEIGDHVLSTLPNGKTGYMGGTSQAAAIHTGKIVRQMVEPCDR